MMQAVNKHIPVMLNEVLHYLQPEDGKVYVDATFGAGGYSNALLENYDCIVYAIDRDPEAKKISESLSKKYHGRLRFIQGCFGNIEQLLAEKDINKVDGIMLDIGVSSMQLDNSERGFSFMHNANLDMRMSQDGVDAYHVINNFEEQELADIIYKYGEEHCSRRIARKIVAERNIQPIQTTHQLASIVRSVVRKGNKKIDPSTKTFQAIRIWVNDELNELENVLKSAEKILVNNGKLVIVTFHSLEDSIVKSFFNEASCKKIGTSRYLPAQVNADNPSFEIITRNAVKPSNDEINSNPRSRSAKLRAAKKVGGIT
jgi:16S rRNA (cytosine1402-N4)-methyltransferase